MMIAQSRRSEIENHFQQNRKALVVTGSLEQHGLHLPYGTDLIIPEAIARTVADTAKITAVPPVAFGLSDCHMEFPGTITLRAETFFCLLEDIISSLMAHGYSDILIVNGHGGNTPVLNDLIRRFANRIKVTLAEWWTLPENIEVMKNVFGATDYHAAAAETSLMLYIANHLVDLQSACSHPLNSGNLFPTKAEFRRWYPNGAVGPDPRLASPIVGRQLFTNAVEACLQRLGLS